MCEDSKDENVTGVRLSRITVRKCIIQDILKEGIEGKEDRRRERKTKKKK